MSIIENINERLSFDMETIGCGGEKEIEQVLSKSPIQLPDDYIELLKSIVGPQNVGVEFLVKNDGSSICIWSAKMALTQYEDYHRMYTEDFFISNELVEFIESVWFFGNDLGDLVYFYGKGKDGLGLYRVEDGSLGVEEADKIADTFTDFLVNGVGIDTAITL